MTKEDLRRNTLATVLFLLGIVVVLLGDYFNDRYKEKHGIDISSGSTQKYE